MIYIVFILFFCLFFFRLNESESIYKDVVQSSMFDDFFNEDSLEARKDMGSKIQLASFEIGNYKPEDVQWKIEDNQVMVRGLKKRSTSQGIFASKFARCITIPQDILPDTVTTRFCSRDGVLIVEGYKKPTKSRKISRSAFFSDSHFSLSIDLGDDNPLNIGYTSQTEEDDKTIRLF